MKNLYTSVFLTASLLFSPLLIASGLGESQQTAIESLTRQIMEAGHYPSITVLIDRGGNTLYSNSIGMADLEQDREAQVDSAYPIGSITKSFTALSTLQLVEQGRIDLDMPVSTYLENYQGPAAAIQVRHLLNHTSGIPNYTNAISGLNQKLRRAVYSREEMVAFFAQLPLEFEPGEKFSYSNSGYYLLGLIIEKVTGITYYDYLQVNVFDPLGMERSYSGDDSELIPGRVRGYELGPNGYLNAPPWSHLVPYAAGSLVSTASDLARYRRGVFKSSHFSPELRQLLLMQTALNNGMPNIYALGGLIISEFNGHPKYSHSGDIWGFAANHAYYPDEDLTIVILSNRQADAPSVVSLEQKIARVLFDVAPPEIRDLVLDDEALGRLQGDYILHPFIFGPPVYGFVAKEGKLFLKFGGVDAEGHAMPLLAQGEGRFVFAYDDEWSFEFESNDGPSAQFTARARDGVFFGNRMD